MGVAYKFNVNTTAASDVDLTSVDNNPDLVPVATPREGGFTLRNRINAANLTTANTYLLDPANFDSATAATTVERMRIIEVPPRVLVRELWLRSVPGATAPTTAAASASSVATSFANGVDLQFGGSAWKEAAKTNLLQNATDGWNGVSSIDGCIFGQLAMTKATLTTDGLPTLASASTPWLGAIKVALENASATKERGMYFPYGGFVNMYMGPTGVATTSVVEAASSDSVNVVIAGVWDFVAVCDYLPE